MVKVVTLQNLRVQKKIDTDVREEVSSIETTSEAVERLRLELKNSFDAFYNAAETYATDSSAKIPVQARNEFLNTVSHLITTIELVSDEDKRKELQKANRHMTRALLDYYKYMLLTLPSKEKAGFNDQKEFDLLKDMLQVRIIEVNSIGTSHKETIDMYAGILEKYHGPVAVSSHGTSAFVSGEYGEKIYEQYKIFMQLESLLSFVHGQKYNKYLIDAINIFCSSCQLVHDLSVLNVKVKRAVSYSIFERNPDLKEKIMDKHRSSLQAIARKDDSEAEEVGYIFDCVMESMNLNLEKFQKDSK